jgi:hypothetical protein
MSQNNNNKRIIHCSFCDDEGHSISSCQDPRIDIVVKDFEESISLDMECNFKMKYAKYVMNSLYNISDIRILGYQKGLSMNKTSKDMFINEVLDEYYDKTDTRYDEIFTGFNETELLDFAKDISKNSKQWNSRKLSLPKVKKLLGIKQNDIVLHEPNKKKYKTVSSLITVDNSKDEETPNYDFQYFLLPLVNEQSFRDLSPALKKGLNYMYFLSFGALVMNAYVIYTQVQDY